MKGDSTELVLLFDLYGAALTEKQQELFDFYHNADLSLSEIAENEGISRQGVRDTLIRAEKQLRDLEARLGLQRRYGKIEQAMARIIDMAQEAQRINAAGLLSVALDDCLREIALAAEGIGSED